MGLTAMSASKFSVEFRRILEDMMRKWKFVFLVLLALWFGGVSWAVADEAAEEKALEAAQTWLALVDEGEYAKSWETAAQYFKSAVTMEQWQQAMSAVRIPLGTLVSRKLQSRQYATSLPGAPDGEYVIIQFEASFENKMASVETVTPMLDRDGKWRVSGYFIK
jgi:hypothetical protein